MLHAGSMRIDRRNNSGSGWFLCIFFSHTLVKRLIKTGWDYAKFIWRSYSYRFGKALKFAWRAKGPPEILFFKMVPAIIAYVAYSRSFPKPFDSNWLYLERQTQNCRTEKKQQFFSRRNLKQKTNEPDQYTCTVLNIPLNSEGKESWRLLVLVWGRGSVLRW